MNIEVILMNKNQFIEFVNTTYLNKPIPSYVEIEDISTKQIKVNNSYINAINRWGIFEKDGSWIFVRTDNERGYINIIKEFKSEMEVIDYARQLFENRVKAQEGNSELERAIRYIQDKYQYSEKRATLIAKQIYKHDDIFEEFFNYTRTGKFRKKDRTQVNVLGYTAEQLNDKYNLSPLGAYNYLIYLKEEPDSAIKDLQAGLPRK